MQLCARVVSLAEDILYLSLDCNVFVKTKKHSARPQSQSQPRIPAKQVDTNSHARFWTSVLGGSFVLLFPIFIAALIVGGGQLDQAWWAMGSIGLATQPVALSLIGGPIAIVVALMTLGGDAFSGRFRRIAPPAAAAIGVVVAVLCTLGADQDRTTAASLPAVFLASLVVVGLAVAVGMHALESPVERYRHVTSIVEGSQRAIEFLDKHARQDSGVLRRFILTLLIYSSAASALGILVMNRLAAPALDGYPWGPFLVLGIGSGMCAAATGYTSFVAFTSYATSRRSARDELGAAVFFLVGSSPAPIFAVVLLFTPTVQWLAVPFISAWVVPLLGTAPGLLAMRAFPHSLSNALFDLAWTQQRERFRKAEQELRALAAVT